MDIEEICSVLKSELMISELQVKAQATPETLIIQPADLFSIASFLHENERFYFDLLSCITGIDNGAESGTMELVYHLYSIPKGFSLGLALELKRENPEVSSLSKVWRAANWLEREQYDLMGINFLDHPDLRRILLPNDWEGHPLRKDYELQAYYHGVKTTY